SRFVERSRLRWRGGYSRCMQSAGRSSARQARWPRRGRPLGRHQEAVATLDATLAGMDPRLRAWRAAALADQGAAYAHAGDLDAAVGRLERALQLAHAAADHVNRVRGVRNRDLSRWADEPAVRRLDDALSAS